MNKLLILIVLFLIILIGINITSKFGDILGEDDIVVLDSDEINMLDFSFKYSIPPLPTFPKGVTASFYKWPLLYLIDSTNTIITANTLPSEYTKPPPKALLNMEYTTYGGNGLDYYAPSDPDDGEYFPNLINLKVLLSDSGPNLIPHPNLPFNVKGDIIPEKSLGGWILPGLSTVIIASLAPGRKYILGISLQLINNYINIQGNDKFLAVKPIEYRYGNFKYVDLKYSLDGLKVIAPEGTAPLEPSFSLTI